MSDMLRLAPWSEYDVRDIPTLKARIAAGANVNKRLPEKMGIGGDFPLEVAAYYGNVEACRLLLAAGADIKVGRGPLVVAIEGRASTLKDVRERRFSREVMIELITALVQAGTNPNGESVSKSVSNDPAQNNLRYVRLETSPLFMAIKAGDVPAIETLVALGADINLPVDAYSIAMGMDGRRGYFSALQYASEEGRHNIVAHLIKAGANEDCFFNTEDGMNALQVSVRRGHCKAVEYLVRERGEDIAQRFNGRTMLQWARPKDTEMKALLNSLKTELVVNASVEPHTDLDGQGKASKSKSLAL